jgi:hypothetical protein
LRRGRCNIDTTAEQSPGECQVNQTQHRGNSGQWGERSKTVFGNGVIGRLFF